MDNLSDKDRATRFLKELGLLIDEDVVRQVVTAIRNGEKTYRFWHGSRDIRAICGKGTVTKIRRLYEKGSLDLYVEYLASVSGSDRREEVFEEKGNKKIPAGPVQTGGNEVRREDGPNSAIGIRDHLGVLLLEAQNILAKLPETRDPFPGEELQTWETHAENYIRDNLGVTYLVQFRTDAGIQIPPALFTSEQNRLTWNKLQCRSARLDKLITELRAGPSLISDPP